MINKYLSFALYAKYLNKDKLIKKCEDVMLEGSDNLRIVAIASLYSDSSNADVIDIFRMAEEKSTNLVFLKFHEAIISEIKHKYANHFDKLILKLLEYYAEFKEPLDGSCSDFFWSRLYDDYHLRQEGFRGSMKMPDELMEYLNRYKSNMTLLDFFIDELLALSD